MVLLNSLDSAAMQTEELMMMMSQRREVGNFHDFYKRRAQICEFGLSGFCLLQK